MLIFSNTSKMYLYSRDLESPLAINGIPFSYNLFKTNLYSTAAYKYPRVSEIGGQYTRILANHY